MLFEWKKFVQIYFLQYWKSFVIILTPLVLLPLVFHGKEGKAGYGVLIIITYWLTSAMPSAITSLLPIVLFPLMNIMSTSEVCSNYLKEANIVFFGGVVMALGVEKSNLHRRLALKVMLIVGSNPRWLMLGFMTVSMLLSMWISNAGVTAMMIPIVDAVVDELFPEDDLEINDTVPYPDCIDVVIMNKENELHAKRNKKALENKRRIQVAFLISICYAANIGGIGTLIGSGAPLAFQGILEELYGTETGMSFAGWMAVGTPVAMFTTFFGWVWLLIYFNDYFRSARQGDESSMRDKKDIKNSIRNQYKELGPITFYEIAVMFLFSIMILLWFFKDPKFMFGWKDAFPKEYKIGDASVAIVVVILAFILPSKPQFWCFSKPGEESRSSPALLDWAYVQRKFPWNVLLVLGGGYVISDASKASGLSHSVGGLLSSLTVLPPFAVMFFVSVIASALTEIASNTAVVSILLPVAAQIAEVIKVNPLYLMIPVTIGCCHTFMLPVGTPPNAMVFSACKIKPREMIKAGAIMNVIAIVVLCSVMETIGVPVFDLHADNMPVWVGGQDKQVIQPPSNQTWAYSVI